MQHQAEEKAGSCFGKGFVAYCSLTGQRPGCSREVFTLRFVCSSAKIGRARRGAHSERNLEKQDLVKMEELLIGAGKSARFGTVRRPANTADTCATGYAVEDVDGPALSACFDAVMPCLELLDRISDLGARFALPRAVSAHKD